MTRAFVFPGQGSQVVGMGKDLAGAFLAARLVFEEVDDALSLNLSNLMFEGPEDELTLTENAQPALMCMSIAVLRVMESEGNLKLASVCRYVAGHSLGEYSALAAAGAIPIDAVARVLRARGKAMQRAVPVGYGAMAALLGMDLVDVREIAKDAQHSDQDKHRSADGICAAANDNAPGQVVISGDKATVERAIALATERGAKRAIMLDVSAPFHCPLMQPAADEMLEVLDGVQIIPPTVPVISNVSAQAESDPETIRRLLVEQITKMVRWRESVEYMRDHDVETVIEMGVGKVLMGLTRRIDPSLMGMSASSPGDIEGVLKSL